MIIGKDSRPPFERVHDTARIQESMVLAVQEALVRHKLARNPIAVWRNERVEWIRPEDIPDTVAEGT
jgi:hypothetical protein